MLSCLFLKFCWIQVQNITENSWPNSVGTFCSCYTQHQVSNHNYQFLMITATTKEILKSLVNLWKFYTIFLPLSFVTEEPFMMNIAIPPVLLGKDNQLTFFSPHFVYTRKRVPKWALCFPVKLGCRILFINSFTVSGFF